MDRKLLVWILILCSPSNDVDVDAAMLIVEKVTLLDPFENDTKLKLEYPRDSL